MYLHQIKINNIRSIKAFELSFHSKEYAGWHVIIGDNGAGKSTLVRAIALALVGPLEAMALRQTWAEWLRQEESEGHIELQVDHDSALDQKTGRGASTRKYIPVSICFQKQSHHNSNVVLSHNNRADIDPNCYLWGNGTGWFSASYGPFRRFTGGDREFERIFQSNPRLAPHLSVFGENIALTECLDWLRDLHIKQLEGQTDGKILADLKNFLNEGGLLPYNTVLEKISADAIVFRDGNGCVVPAPQLSDGYRSILSITFELIRQMVRTYGANAVFKPIQEGQRKIDLPGVVLIDEIDAHLHPSWQRRIGHWFRRYFPNLQFIVTTHSPLVCQAAELGTVWRLPTPGTDLVGGRVEGIELQRLVYGNILEALDTDLFGNDVTRSESSKEKLQRLAFLNRNALRAKLSHSEEKERQQLRSVLPTAVNVTE
jgi:energy-coupling factor transporter ATP-binding protein EcfA2